MDKKPKFDRFLRRQHRQNAKTRVSDPRTPSQMVQDMEATYTNSQPNVSVNEVRDVVDQQEDIQNLPPTQGYEPGEYPTQMDLDQSILDGRQEMKETYANNPEIFDNDMENQLGGFSPEQAAADYEQSHDYQLNNPASFDPNDLSPTAEFDGPASTEYNPDQHPRPPRGTSNMILSGARKLGKAMLKTIPFAGPAGAAIGGLSAINDAHNAGKRFANTADPENIDSTINDLRTRLGLGRRDR